MESQADMVNKSRIYAYRWPGEAEAIGLAMYVDPDYHGFKGICFLTPPHRGHMIEGELGKKTETGFTFISWGFAAGEWEFTELTYENFKSEYHVLAEGSDEILSEVSSTEELQEWYHSHFPMQTS